MYRRRRERHAVVGADRQRETVLPKRAVSTATELLLEVAVASITLSVKESCETLVTALPNCATLSSTCDPPVAALLKLPRMLLLETESETMLERAPAKYAT